MTSVAAAHDPFAPGQKITYMTSEGEVRSGTVVQRVTVGDFQSFDVGGHGATPVIVSGSQVLGHPSYRDKSVQSLRRTG